MESRYSLLFPSFHYNKLALRSGLWLVWVCGFFLIGISFYYTQMLPSSVKDQIEKLEVFTAGLVTPKITLFTAPRPFTGLTGQRQALAVRSWLGLSESVNVVFFSQDPSVFSFADSCGSQVSVEPNIDFTFTGTPFFHSMVARCLAYSASDITALIDPATILLPDFITTLRHAYKFDEHWVLVALSQNISHFPFDFDSGGKKWLGNDGKHVRMHKLQDFLARNCSRSYGDKMIIAWNNGDVPLHKGVLPPFLYGKGIHNRWIVTEALISDYRLVIDASSSFSSLFVNNPDNESPNVSDYERNSGVFGNLQLGGLYGSFSFREANYSNLFHFSKCSGDYLLVNTVQNIVYPLNFKKVGFMKKKRIVDCVDTIKSLEGIHESFSKKKLRFSEPVLSLLSLESLLPIRADENKTVVLGIAGYSYKDMLMSWACRLNHLKVSNFLVCALDNEIYEFSILQGLPVIKCRESPRNISFDDCHFGTKCFQKVTKVKSRMVLQILKLGYNVLFSDVDVYWFKNPLAYLSSFGPAVLVAQSDEYNTTGPINLPRRLNSGFYYAHSDNTTIAALEMVVKHATHSNLSEQPSFYDTLCGEGGSNRLGDNHCGEPETNLLVHFLNRDLFPNGAYLDLWQEKDVNATCMDKGSFVIHNNWISGRKKKLERQVSSGLWAYDINTRMCLQSWHTNSTTSYF